MEKAAELISIRSSPLPFTFLGVLMSKRTSGIYEEYQPPGQRQTSREVISFEAAAAKEMRSGALGPLRSVSLGRHDDFMCRPAMCRHFKIDRAYASLSFEMSLQL